MHRILKQNFLTIWVIVLLVAVVLYFGWHLTRAGARTWTPATTTSQSSTPSTTVYATLEELCAHVDAVNCPPS